ncbi:GntR family transcriptional regulator [Streptacidiphilus sp. MAP12-16]|jgi:GntR family transcriptional regulator|uniref:GntR family transcriptional regulator n=1 Tax=Streptacidiphilus sp. MAP12-16 TaxID=3156300 RepID=UPI003517C4D4
MSIDREGPVPPYVQIADALRGRIASGEIAPGKAIPSLVDMEQEFGVARDTLRKAVKVLKDAGLVHTVSGLGTFVVDKPPTPGS